MHVDVCAKCMASGDNERPIQRAPFFKARVIAALEGRLAVGDMPRYQQANPVDVKKALKMFRLMTGEPAVKNLVRKMFATQAPIPEEKGGHPADQIGPKFVDMAEAEDMIPELEEIVYEYQKRRGPAGRVSQRDRAGRPVDPARAADQATRDMHGLLRA